MCPRTPGLATSSTVRLLLALLVDGWRHGFKVTPSHAAKNAAEVIDLISTGNLLARQD
jgi:hypothetical protein